MTTVVNADTGGVGSGATMTFLAILFAALIFGGIWLFSSNGGGIPSKTDNVNITVPAGSGAAPSVPAPAPKTK